LSFFAAGTSTPLNTYSDKGLTSANANPVILNSAGRAAVDIFLQDLSYKIVLKDSLGNTIWTTDNYTARDSQLIAKTVTGSGSPSGVVAGTAGSASILPDFYWDYTNAIFYVCTTTGNAAAAVWTALNASASTPAVPAPQGRLTLTSATPVLAADVVSATAVYYTPSIGNLVPIYNGASMTPTEFSELTLTLSASHAINTIYDVFVFSNSGALTLATGPAWNTSTAGSGARGSGASTTQLTRIKGLYVNAVAMTGRNGATTYAIGANAATYLGSIFIDGVAGQVTCHVAYGQSRKWGVWNAYNRAPITLQMGDATATWAYSTATIRQSRADATNTVAVFTGLPEEEVAIHAVQSVLLGAGALVGATTGIGLNSTTTFSGKTGKIINTVAGANQAYYVDTVASYFLVPTIGINNINYLELGSGTATTTFNGGIDDMLLTARWRG